MRYSGADRIYERPGDSPFQAGCKFSCTDATVLTLTPSGIDSTAQVAITTGEIITLTESLTCDILVSGINGLDTGYKDHGKGYYIFLITQADGVAPALLASLSDTAPILPDDYTCRTAPIWFISVNNRCQIRAFIDIDGYCFYSEVGDTILLIGGLGHEDWTLIDCSPLVPNNSIAYIYSYARSKSSSVWNQVEYKFPGSDKVCSTFKTHFQNITGVELPYAFPIADASNSIYYKWQTNPGIGGTYSAINNVWCRGWTLL